MNNGLAPPTVTPPAAGVRIVSTTEALRSVLAGLGFAVPAEAGSTQEGALTSIAALAVFAEALRAALWTLSAGGSDPVYVTRLLNAARPLVAPVLPAMKGDEGRVAGGGPASLERALEELESLGDMASLPRGRWLPAPLRCVPLPNIKRWILLGGRPARFLPSSLKRSLELSGATRLLNRDPAASGLPIPVQPENDWLQAPAGPLEDWMQRVLVDTSMRPFDDPDAEFDCYAPAIRGRRSQYNRWIPDPHGLPNGYYLLRHKSHSGRIHHSFGEIRSGIAIATGELELDGGDVRRLMYALDATAGYPVGVRISGSEDTRTFELRNELPGPELRLFTALGRLHLTANGSYYPRFWEVSTVYAAQAASALVRLGIRLDGQGELIAPLVVAGARTEPDTEG